MPVMGPEGTGYRRRGRKERVGVGSGLVMSKLATGQQCVRLHASKPPCSLSRPGLILSAGRALHELSAPGSCGTTEDQIARLCRRPQAHGALIRQADARQAAVLRGYAVRVGGIGGRAKLNGTALPVKAATADPDAIHGKKPRRGLGIGMGDRHTRVLFAMKLI